MSQEPSNRASTDPQQGCSISCEAVLPKTFAPDPGLDRVSAEVRSLLCELAPRIMRMFEERGAVSTKWDGSAVTETDKLVNAALSQSLPALVPGSFYLGEESADETFGDYEGVLAHDCIWAVDEIDGTQNFGLGIPIFGVSVGLLRRDPDGHRPVMGALLLPALGELYYQEGGAVFKQKLGDGRVTKLEPCLQAMDRHSVVLVPDNFYESYTLDRSSNPQLPRIVGCVVADIIYTATGRAAGTITDFHIWDFAGSLALARLLGVEMRAFESGEIKSAFVASDFVQGARNKNWCTKDTYIISNEANYGQLRGMFKPIR